MLLHEGAVVLFSQLFCMLQVSLLSTGDPRESLENLLQLFPIICSKCSMKLLIQSPTDGQYVNETRTNG